MAGQVDTREAKKAVLEALETHYGIVTDSCKATGLNRSTFYEWLKSDSQFKLAVDELQEVALDFVEGKLFERINGVEVIKGYDKDGQEILYSLPPDVQAISLYLKTRGKKRGYVERTEVAPVDPDGNALTLPSIVVNVIKGTDKNIPNDNG